MWIRWIARTMRVLAAVVLCAAAGSASAQADASTVSFQEPNEDSLLILEARTGRYILADVFFAYEEETGLFLPLSQLFEIVDFPIDVSPGKKKAEGWFLAEDNRFHLDLNRLSVRIDGETHDVPADAIRLHFDEIYVDSVLLEQWFPFRFRIDYAQLRLLLVTEKPLPFQKRLERHKNWERHKQRYRSRIIEPTDYLKLPAEPFSLPNVAVRAKQTMSRDDAEWHHTSATTLQWANDLLGAQFSGATTLAQGTTDRTELNSTRLKLRRETEEAELLGPLEAREWEIGDLRGPTLPIVGGQSSGRGVAVSNEPDSFVSDIDNYVLEGEATVGYDIELYQNNRLTDFQTVGEDGRYRFEDISLQAGMNILRLAFYGPRGEYFEETERVLIGGNMENVGAFTYDFAAFESPDSIVRGSDSRTGNPHRSGILKMDYGLTRFTTLAGGLYHGPLDGRVTQAASIGVRSAFGPHFLQADTVVQPGGRMAVAASVRSSFEDFTSILSHEQFSGYPEEERSVKTNSSLTLSHNIPLKGLANVNDSWSVSRQASRDDPTEYGVQNTLSVNFRHTALANRLKTTVADGQHWREDLEGALSLRYKLDGLTLRNQWSYDIDRDPGANRASVSATYRSDRDISGRLRFSRRMEGDDRNDLSGEVSKQFDRFSAGLSFSGDNGGDRTVGLVLRTTFLRDKSDLGYDIYDRGVSHESGTLYLNAFRDTNANGRMDAQEQRLPGAVFDVQGGQRKVTADINGQAVVNGLPAGRPVRISLDKGSLDDIFLMPVHEVIEVEMTPSRVGTYAFAVQQLGMIEGMVYANGQEQGAVDLELWNAHGKKVKTVTSEFDGFFLIEDVLPGDYRIRLAPSSAERFRPMQAVAVTLPADDPYAIADINVEKRAEPRETVAAL